MGFDEVAFEGLVAVVVIVGIVRLRELGGPDLVRRSTPWIAVFVAGAVPFPLVLRAIEDGLGGRALLFVALPLAVVAFWRGLTLTRGGTQPIRRRGWLVVAGSAISIVAGIVAILTMPAS